MTSDLSEKLTGQQKDEIRLDYFIARHFSGAQGRFTGADLPFVDQWEDDPQSWNLYAYVRNNPSRFVDPTGRDCTQYYAPDGRPTAARCDVWAPPPPGGPGGGFGGPLAACPDVYVDGAFAGNDCEPDWLNRQNFHTTLDFGGLTPGIGIFADLANAGLYLSEGDFWNTGLSLGGALPIAGQFVTGGKLLRGAVKVRGARGGILAADDVLRNAERWLGEGYKEIAPGVFRSEDGLRQFRMMSSDLVDPRQGPHVHLESIATDGRTILENSHVLLSPDP